MVKLTLFYRSDILFIPNDEKCQHEKSLLLMVANHNNVIKTQNMTNNLATNQNFNVLDKSNSSKSHSCQVVYVVGVRGSQHHGTTDVLVNFARRQLDHHNDMPYVVYLQNMKFCKVIDWYGAADKVFNVTYETRRKTMAKLCPPN
jgi:hypothetical protein